MPVWLNSSSYLDSDYNLTWVQFKILKKSVPTSAAKLWKNLNGQEYVIW